jgi:hypothetical protein
MRLWADGDNCSMRRLIICIFRQVKLEWSSEGEDEGGGGGTCNM